MDRLIKYFFITPQSAAKTPILLATSPEVDMVTEKYFVKGKPVPASPICYDLDFAKKVWEISERLVGI